ncbi:MAG: UbiA family prenyltransferase [Candidatus Marinimicrobia bacterium]|nr:UbiA family prenyltransferase [Candidatus Neomarinimicrobiota bacterium]
MPASGTIIRRLVAHLLLMHPFTSLAVAGVTMVLAIPRAGPLDISRILPVGLAMLLIQLTIGITNDLLDRPYDAAAKPSKPIASGQVNPGTALIMASGLLIGAMGLGLRLGPLPWGIMLFGLACGLAYNLGLKRTFISWLPHALAAPTLLLWVRAINGELPGALLWAYPLGLLLGPALNLANQLFGAEAAAASGERSFLYYVGVRQGRRLAAGLFLVTAGCLPMVISISRLPVRIAVVGALTAAGLSVVFLVVAELDRRVALWPLALAIAAVLGVAFHLSIP